MLAAARRIEIVREYVSTRRDWIEDDGIVNTLVWGELYRRIVPESVRVEHPFGGNATRKMVVRRELRRRLGFLNRRET